VSGVQKSVCMERSIWSLELDLSVFDWSLEFDLSVFDDEVTGPTGLSLCWGFKSPSVVVVCR
jgi:hypothetical protein